MVGNKRVWIWYLDRILQFNMHKIYIYACEWNTSGQLYAYEPREREVNVGLKIWSFEKNYFRTWMTVATTLTGFFRLQRLRNSPRRIFENEFNTVFFSGGISVKHGKFDKCVFTSISVQNMLEYRLQMKAHGAHNLRTAHVYIYSIFFSLLPWLWSFNITNNAKYY